MKMIVRMLILPVSLLIVERGTSYLPRIEQMYTLLQRGQTLIQEAVIVIADSGDAHEIKRESNEVNQNLVI